MKTLHIMVREKVATYMKRDGEIVCGNSDYWVEFDFDSEWDAYPDKTARFIWNGQHFDQPFSGNTCRVPVIKNTTACSVGVYVEGLETTTPAKIDCLKSVLCENTHRYSESDAIYSDEAQEAAKRAEEAAERAEEIAESLDDGTYIESDPTVPTWAKQPTKPTYTASEVGARPATWTPTAKDVGAVAIESDPTVPAWAKKPQPPTAAEVGAPKKGATVPDTAVAHVKPVPEDAAPYAEITEIGGMTYKDGDTLRSAPVTEVESVGGNLLDLSGIDKTASGLNFASTPEGYISVDGVKHGVNEIPVKTYDDFVLPAGEYTLRAEVISGKYTHSTDDTHRIFLNNADIACKVGTSITIMLTEPLTITKVGLSVYPDNGVFEDEVIAVMLYQGNAAIPYRPYVRHTLPIPAEVQALDGYGWGFNDTIYNYIDFEKGLFVQNVAVESLAGYWSTNVSDTVWIFPLSKKVKDASFLFHNYTGEYHFYYEPTINYMCIDKSAFSSAAEVQEFMKDIYVCYVLSTPIITDISHLLPSDNLLPVEAGGTVTMVNEHGYDVPNTVVFRVGNNGVIGADAFVGDLIGTAARAERDALGKVIHKSYAPAVEYVKNNVSVAGWYKLGTFTIASKAPFTGTIFSRLYIGGEFTNYNPTFAIVDFSCGYNSCKLKNLTQAFSETYTKVGVKYITPYEYELYVYYPKSLSSRTWIAVDVSVCTFVSADLAIGELSDGDMNSILELNEYENPPMQLGVEYRTTERWQGKPVYTQLVDCGELANNKTVSVTVADGTAPTVVRVHGSFVGHYIPSYTYGVYAEVLRASSTQFNIILKCETESLVGSKTYVTLWYTKS